MDADVDAREPSQPEGRRHDVGSLRWILRDELGIITASI
jgi:hypothetical protein